MPKLIDRLKPGVFLRTGHRGAGGMAPENTIEAIWRGVAAGIDLAEIDVQATADGRIVLLHDESVDRTTNGRGLIERMRYEDAAKLDAGFRFGPPDFPFRGRGVRIPLLEEVFQVFPSLGFTIEIKPSSHPEFIRNLASIVRAHNPGRVIVASDAADPLNAFRSILPDVPINCPRIEVQRFYFLAKIGLGSLVRLRGNVFQVPVFSGGDGRSGVRVVTRRFLEAAHRAGRPVQVWTVNDPAEMRRLMDIGVDGLTTDRPDVLHDIWRQRSASAMSGSR